MNMIKETYERLFMDVTEFDAEDIITTSGEGGGGGTTPGGNTPPVFNPDNPWEMPVGM